MSILSSHCFVEIGRLQKYHYREIKERNDVAKRIGREGGGIWAVINLRENPIH
jgi:hypothetical protein